MNAKCAVCGCPVSEERVTVLIKDFKKRLNEVTCTKHSTTRAPQAIWLGEVGTSELLLVNKVGVPGINQVFYNREDEEPSRDINVDE